MKLRFVCPRCESPQSQDVSASSAILECGQCDWQRTLEPSDPENLRVTHCLACGNRDVWRQKDFPQSVGLTMVAAGAVLSSIAWYFHRPVLALGILLGFAAIDLLLFALMPDVLVCYRCRARHSGGDLSEYPAFNLETAERYRQERLRVEEASHGRSG